MAIAHDSEVLGVANTASGGNYDTSITPTNTPNGVCVIVVNSTAVTDNITSVSYGISTGAVLLTRRRFNTEATEAGGVFVYWGGGVTFPSGAQTVRVVKLSANTNNIRAYIATMTCAAGQQVAVDTDATGTSASVANPSWTMTTGVATTACYLGIHSGITTMLNTPAANWTLAATPGFEDVGAVGRGWARRTFTTGPGNAAPGWTLATADDFVGDSIAFKEIPLSQAGNPLSLLRSPRPVEQNQVAGNYAPISPSTFLGG
jgi:hypothetical protein